MPVYSTDPDEQSNILDSVQEAIDHTHYFPLPTVAGPDNDGAGYPQGFTDTTVPAVFTDPDGHFYLDIGIKAGTGTATGTLSVWTEDAILGGAVLFAKQAFNTTTSQVYRIELAGRRFAVRMDAVTTATSPVFTSLTYI